MQNSEDWPNSGQIVVQVNPLKQLPQQYLKKGSLIVGEYYIGICRNATVARWDGKQFHHWRQKFGAIFIEQISHPDDEPYFDVFQPIAYCPAYQAKEIPIDGLCPVQE